jgi:hypothetical protein
VGCGRWGGWHFAVEVEDHVLLLHLGEHGVEGFIVQDARGGVLEELVIQLDVKTVVGNLL